VFAAFYNGTPAGYTLTHRYYPARSIYAGKAYWQVEGGLPGDPSPLRTTWNDGPAPDTWPEGYTVADFLVQAVTHHAGGAADRIAKKAEADAIEAAEAAVREARAAQLARLAREKGSLATPRQVDYILILLQEREYSGEGGGFFSGPKDRAGLEQLSKREASLYIQSLKGDY
jgi:hypothetical protein